MKGDAARDHAPFRGRRNGSNAIAITATGGESIFEFFDPCQRFGNLNTQQFDQGNDGTRALIVNRLYLFIRQHGAILQKACPFSQVVRQHLNKQRGE